MYSTQNGILVGDEKGVPIPLGSSGARYPSSDNVFVNNLGIGCNHNLAAGTKESNNNLYAFNTFVNAAGSTTEKTNILFYSGTTTNARFVNNIVVQEDDRAIAMIAGSGVTFSNNLWSKSPPPQADNPNNVIGDPALAKIGLFAPGQLTADYFRILPGSPVINRAYLISSVTTDYFLNARGPLPDIGAEEFAAVQSPPLPTPTPTSDPLPQNMQYFYLPFVSSSR